MRMNNQIGGGYTIKLDTYEDYLAFAATNKGKDCQWIYNIIDKTDDANMDRVLYDNDDFVIVTEMHMTADPNTFHLLAFPKDKSIQALRDLTDKHIPLLQEMVAQGKNIVVEKYGFNENEIETHFDYPPGVLLLHIHFELVNNTRHRRPMREHSVYDVVENLQIDSDYYKKRTFEVLVKNF